MKIGFSIKNYLTERNGGNKVSILAHPAFLVVLAIKVAALFFLGSSILTKNYIPFINHFINSPFSNPYEWSLNQSVSFPFPALMLFMVAASKLFFGFFVHLDLFTLRVPVLFADLTIFLVLTRWIKDKKEKVLWYYWCSPILFAISYVAGFLDIVPISLLFAFLYFLFKDKFFLAFTLLGLAFAAKTGLVILLPFVIVYLLKEHEYPTRVFEYVLLSCSIYVLANFEYMSGPGFWKMILLGGQPFTSHSSIDFGGVVLYVMPLVYLGLLAGSLALQRLNRDMFLMFLAFALGSITLFVLPQAGWYCWIIPFFIYFFVREERAKKYPFVLLNMFYFGYFLLAPGSVFLEAVNASSVVTFGNIPVNMAFTLLQGALLLNIVWVYRLGIQYGVRHKILYKPYLIGIAGDSASGKSVVTKLIFKIFGEHNTLEVAGDDMHKWERGDPRWSHTTHLNPIANKLHDDMEHASRLKRNESVVRHFYDHAVGRFTLPERVQPKKVIVFQGLHTLYLYRTRQLLDLKVFLSPNEETRRKWKLERDTKERGHAPETVLRQLDERGADSERYIREQRKHADVIVSIGQTNSQQVLEIECDSSINIDPLVDVLKDDTALRVSHEHDTDTQRLVVVGDVLGEAVGEWAYRLVPEIWEVNRREPQWEDGLNGVIQLFLAYVVFYKAKLDHDAF